MIKIRPVSDLRNKFPEVEQMVREGAPVYLTKNGYGSMVVLSLEAYAQLSNGVEAALDQADMRAMEDGSRLTHTDVFSKARKVLND
jgi:prevent-host-death family protein